jgi:predicted ferric reductase
VKVMLRGGAWFSFYLVLILFPLLLGSVFRPPNASDSFLVNLSAGLGYVGFAIMALELALIARVKPAASAFGLDVLQQFHKEIGMAAFLMVLAHPILLILSGYPARIILPVPGVPFSIVLGTVAFLLVALLITLSIWRKRLKIRYEVWQMTHGLLTIALILTAAWHILRVGRYVQMTPMRVLWAGYLVLLVGLFVYYRLVKPLRLLNKPWRVVENREELGDARTLRLQPIGHPGWPGGFEAGQFAWLNLGTSPFGYEQHPISMSSNGDTAAMGGAAAAGAETGEVAFTIKNLGGWSGQVVPRVKPGQKIWVDGPYGVFTLDREQAPGYVFLAGGVGITPLRAMLVTMAEREDVRPVVLFYGSRHPDDLTFCDELLELQHKMNLKVVYVVEEPPADWHGETGRISGDLLKKYLPTKQYQRWQYFICGPTPMMDALEKVLPSIGVPAEKIQTERFDMV